MNQSSNFYHLYAELITELKAYISQEYSQAGSLVANPDNFNYFKAQALQSRAASGANPPPQHTHKPAASPPATNRVPPPPVIKTQEPISKEPSAPLPVKTPETSLPAKDLESKTEEKPVLDRTLKREPALLQKTSDFTELRKLWHQQCPQIQLIDTIPSDEKAKAVSERWKTAPSAPEILLLYFSENPREKAFLANVAAAISLNFASAGLMSAPKIEADRGWNQLLTSSPRRLIIAQHHSLETLPELMKLYCEDTARGYHTLGRVPLLLLSDLSLYMREPKLKAALWQTLCQRLRARKEITSQSDAEGISFRAPNGRR